MNVPRHISSHYVMISIIAAIACSAILALAILTFVALIPMDQRP